MDKIGKVIFRVCWKLREKKMLPWCIWSPVYDRWHRIGR